MISTKHLFDELSSIETGRLKNISCMGQGPGCLVLCLPCTFSISFYVYTVSLLRWNSFMLKMNLMQCCQKCWGCLHICKWLASNTFFQSENINKNKTKTLSINCSQTAAGGRQWKPQSLFSTGQRFWGPLCTPSSTDTEVSCPVMYCESSWVILLSVTM